MSTSVYIYSLTFRKRHYKNLEKQCEEDEKEILQLYEDQNGFLEKAVYNYVKCLECGVSFPFYEHELCMCRMRKTKEQIVR